MAMIAAGIGAVGSIAGGLLSKPSTPKYRPMDVYSGFGTVDYDKKGRTIKSTLTPEQQALADQYGGLASSYLGGGPYGALSQQTTGMAGAQIPGLFQGALDYSQFNPASTYAYQGLLGGLAGQSAGYGSAMGGLAGAYGGLANQFGGLAQQYNPLSQQLGGIGQQYGALGGATGMLGGQFGNMAGLAQQQAMQAAMGGPVGGGMAQDMYGRGQQLLGSSPQSYQDVFNQRLGLLRQQAAPQEERAQNSFLNRLYSMGQLGPNSTAGNRLAEGFATGLSQADTTRQLDAMNLSEALYGRDLSASLQNRGIGAGLMQGGLGGLQAGAGLQGQLGQGWMGLGGNLLGNQMGAYGQMGNFLGAQQGIVGQQGDFLGAQGGMLGQMGNMYGQAGNMYTGAANLLNQQAQFGTQGYGADMAAQDIVNQRAQQRISNAMSLFGFGSDLNSQALQQGASLQAAQGQMFGNLQNTAALGHTAGQGAMGQMPSVSTSNAIGGVLQGLGGAMMSNPGAWGSMFGFGQPQTGTPFNANNGNYNVASLPAFDPNSIPMPTFNIQG